LASRWNVALRLGRHFWLLWQSWLRLLTRLLPSILLPIPSCLLPPTVPLAPLFTTLSLGRSTNAIKLLVLTAPPVHDPANLKARCFDYLADFLLEHAPLYSSAELIGAFNHIPGSTYNAAIESASICSDICSAFFKIDHLVGLGFRDRHGLPITDDITPDPSTCPSGIYYFAFPSTVTPANFDKRILVGSTTIEFCLSLLQTTSTTTTRRNLFNTPTPAPTPTILLTAADLPFPMVGTAGDSDKLSDYSATCYPLFSYAATLPLPRPLPSLPSHLVWLLSSRLALPPHAATPILVPWTSWTLNLFSTARSLSQSLSFSRRQPPVLLSIQHPFALTSTLLLSNANSTVLSLSSALPTSAPVTAMLPHPFTPPLKP
jgi:hypothetical protein